jgi:LAGLIDADG DNA endonuclease family
MKTTILRFINKLLKHFDDNDYKKAYRKKVIMPLFLDQVLIGLLLSDGSLERHSLIVLVRLSVIFSSKHLPYLLHLFNLFEPYTDSGVRLIEVYNKKNNTKYTQVAFKTVSLPVFLKYYNMFYVLNEKQIK